MAYTFNICILDPFLSKIFNMSNILIEQYIANILRNILLEQYQYPYQYWIFKNCNININIENQIDLYPWTVQISLLSKGRPTVKFNFRQVTVQCKERGHLLSKLRQRYADLMARIPRQVRVTKRIIFKICSGLYLELKLILESISERPSSYSANVKIWFLKRV